MQRPTHAKTGTPVHASLPNGVSLTWLSEDTKPRCYVEYSHAGAHSELVDLSIKGT